MEKILGVVQWSGTWPQSKLIFMTTKNIPGISFVFLKGKNCVFYTNNKATVNIFEVEKIHASIIIDVQVRIDRKGPWPRPRNFATI